jgi:hypothetical protein
MKATWRLVLYVALGFLGLGLLAWSSAQSPVVRILVGAMLIGALVAAVAATDDARDGLARLVAIRQLPVGLVLGETSPRTLFAFLATGPGGQGVVLAQSQDSAAQALLSRDGAAVALSCPRLPYRIVLVGVGWRVALLPARFAFLGKHCEHGGSHEQAGEGSPPPG